ncbi:MAG: acetylglutamate kinase [Flavobacteriales bacterium]|nr:acetylglutamate kinase [Flavobacteriales bacterium]
MEKLYIIKIGGNVIDSQEAMTSFLSDFSKIKGNKILVHGGGKIATKMAEKIGIEAKMVNGRRITDRPMLDIVSAVYGTLNAAIVEQLKKFECKAMSVFGNAYGVIEAHKREVKDIDYGFVGDVDKVTAAPVTKMLSEGSSPIFAPLTHDGETMLNTNADTIASALAVGMSKDYETKLIYCFEKKGVLKDVNDDASVINDISTETYEQLKTENVIHDGMIPKMDNSFDAIAAGVNEVWICHADDLKKILIDGEKHGSVLHA